MQKIAWLAQSENRIGDGTLWVHAGWSVLRFLSGFLLALVVGVPLGLVMGRSRLVGDLLDPLFNTLRNVPPIAWAPFALLWFGASFGSQTFVIFTAAFPPILMNSHRGIRLVDDGLIKAARMLGAKPAAVLFRVALPAALPLVVAGARIGVANGWLALVGAEIVAGPGALTGLGFLVLVGQQNLQAVFSISAMVVIGLLGAAFDNAMVRLERTLSKR
ncbi:ABC transporter permease [Methylibium sp.]|uniref:ABC transporter permease n=1 Tax=Methylibium sp. TaxID=2067992 RepID=UPI003D12E1D4